jgi:hypothetical protein
LGGTPDVDNRRDDARQNAPGVLQRNSSRRASCLIFDESRLLRDKITRAVGSKC